MYLVVRLQTTSSTPCSPPPADYTTSLDMWGVGCILVEMIAGVPCFPGVRDVADQLDKIFRVTGTPDPRAWPTLTSLPHYKPEKLARYRPRRLSDVFPRLIEMPHAESLANRLLHVSSVERGWEWRERGEWRV